MRQASIFVLIAAFHFSLPAWTQSRSDSRSSPSITYDLGVSTGSRSGHVYSEIELGLNWMIQDFMIWRNSIFTRYGSNMASVSGLDSSARLFYKTQRDEKGFGVDLFAGPGLRISNKENTGAFVEAGATVRAGGFSFGAGLKSIYYENPGRDSQGRELSKTDPVFFLILSGGGAF